MSESGYEQTILQMNYNSFAKFHCKKKCLSHNMTNLVVL